MTWEEAGAFCKWAGGRLPTEAEWEYAARAGNERSRYGSLDSIAWYGDSWDGLHGVGLKEPNTWRLYDMLGNVWQWTADWHGEKYYDKKEGIDPQGPGSGIERGLRGGSWSHDPVNVRVSYRGRYGPGIRNRFFGVRCVGEVP